MGSTCGCGNALVFEIETTRGECIMCMPNPPPTWMLAEEMRNG